MVGDGSNVPDRDRWPDGRLARITSGELDGMYMLVAPETAGRWIVYIAADPQTTPQPLPYLDEWSFDDDAGLETALSAQEFSWVRGKDEALIEQRIFGLREEWRREEAGKGWLRDLLDPSIRRPRRIRRRRTEPDQPQ
jgi:hypothetical protein